MRLSICGTDERSLCLRKFAQERGYVLSDQRADAVVLPLPRSKMSDLKRIYPAGQKIICGQSEDALIRSAKENGWELMNVLEDEAFLRENAELTAEGALYYAMKGQKRALRKATCLVMGYGRIGKALQKRLESMGAEVIVAARKESSRKEAGEKSVDIDGMKKIIGQMDFVFNTVPCILLGEKEVKQLKKDVLFMELASPPYGVDMEAAAAHSVSIRIEGSIPGRYCPMEAAGVWMDFIERRVLK